MPDLTGMPALDLAIGLSFIFLMLSLLCSTIQESISALLGLRAKKLELGLRAMLTHDTARNDGNVKGWFKEIWPWTERKLPRDLVNHLYDQPLIRGLRKKS